MSSLKTRNKVFFQGIYPGDPTNIIFLKAHYIRYWSGLQKTELQKLQVRGAKLLIMAATEVFHRRQGWGPMILRLTE